MIKAWNFFLILFLMSLMTSCIPLTEGKIDVKFVNQENNKKLNAFVSSVSINSNQLIITGSNLSKVKTVTLKNKNQVEAFQIERGNDSQIITNGIKNISFLVGSVFNLVLADAHGEVTYQVAFSLTDGSVTASKLNSMGATAGQILKYNGIAWAPASAIDAQTFIGTWDAHNNIGGVPDLTTISSIAGDYYVVTVAGILNGVSYDIGDWIISDGYSWNKIPLSQTSVTSFQNRKGIVTLGPSDYVSLIDGTTHKVTGSSLSDIADIDLTANGGLSTSGQVLMWNTATLKWEPGNAIGSGGIGSSDIGTGAITNSHISATANISQSKISNLATDLAAKQNSLSLAGDVRVITLSGITSDTGDITATDTILSAFGKLMNMPSDYVSKTGATTISGTVNFTNPTSFLYTQTPSGITPTEVANVEYVTNAIEANGVWSKGASNSIHYSSGNVGIGTGSTTPFGALHINNNNGTDAIDDIWVTTYSNTASPGMFFTRARGNEATPSTSLSGDVLFSLSASGHTGTVGRNAALIRAVATSNFSVSPVADLFFATNGGAAAASEKMRITGGGNVGIGTTAPSAKLSIAPSSTSSGTITLTAANAATTFTTSASTTLNAGDYLVPATTTGQSRAVTIGGTGTSFTVSPAFSAAVSGETYTIYPAVINAHSGKFFVQGSTGRIGIGTVNPNYNLDVTGDINATGCLRSSVGVASGTCVSDERLKKDIHSFNLGLKALLGINPKYFKYNGLGNHPVSAESELGVIAQDVEKSAPALIKTKMVKLNSQDSQLTEVKQVNYTAFIYVVINSIKEFYYNWLDDRQDVHLELASLREKTNKLELENAQMKVRLEKIEKTLKMDN